MDDNLFGKGKTIIFFSVQAIGIELLMIEELRNYGFDVVSINEELNKKYIFHYPNIFSFLYCKYRKIVFKDKQPSKEAKDKFYQKNFLIH